MTTSQTEINTNSNNLAGGVGSADTGGGGGGGMNGAGTGVGGGGGNQTNQQNMPISAANSATISEVGKRKKLKSRNALPASSVGNNSNSGSGGGGGYSKDHLDAWLETCLKDASTAQLSSSSEFLDYNPTTNNMTTTSAAAASSSPLIMAAAMSSAGGGSGGAAMTSNNLNKNIFALPQQQQQQLQQQQQQQQNLFNMANMNQQQQQFTMRPATATTNPINTMPNNSAYNLPAFSQGFGRSMPNFLKQSSSYNNRYSMMFPPMGSNVGGGYDGSQDFASLPPMVNIMGGSGGGGGNSSEHEINSTDVLDGSGSNPNISRGFRFSDPCLLNPSDNDSKMSGQNTPDRRNIIASDMEQNNKFFTVLMEQIQLLHETNSKICRDLHEAKVCIEVLKHAPNLGMRHRRDSISGLSTHSQPMVFGSGFGTQSPAPSYHSGAYTPGMMTDVVREVKDAARVREDALLNRVKVLVEERQWSMNESNLRMMRDIEDLKSQIHHMRLDRKENNKRINHLEAENKYMRQMLAALYNNRSVPDIIYENETLRTRKSYPHHARRTQQPMNLHYGTIHHQAASSSLDEHEEEEPLHIVETPSTTSTADIASIAAAAAQRPSEMRNSFSSSDGGSINGGGGGGGGGVGVGIINSANIPHGSNHSSPTKLGPIMSPPNFALISKPHEDQKRKKEKLASKKSLNDDSEHQQSAIINANSINTHDLSRELKDAVAARKDADERIIALEKLVKNLQVNANHPSSSSNTNHDNMQPQQQQQHLANGESGNHGNRGSNTNSKVSSSHAHTKSGGGGGGDHGDAISRPSSGSNNKASTNSKTRPTITKSSATSSSSVSATQPSGRSKWLHQQNVTTSTTVHSSPVKLSVAGPITDL